jgi:predicted nuclease with TOPRIM domain
MDAVAGQDDSASRYTTPRWVQVWFLQRSRDNWKKKYRELKAERKRLQNRVNDVTRSRESWRQRVKELEAENAVLQEQAALKKGGPRDGAAV